MSAPLSKDGREHLRTWSLTVAEIKTLKFLRDNGGEQMIVLSDLKPLAQAVVKKLEDEDLVELAAASDLVLTRRQRLRLTDLGRRCCEYFDSLEAGPKKEIRV